MRQINVKYPCVGTYEKHETWLPYHSCCSLYLLPKMTECHGTEEIPFHTPPPSPSSSVVFLGPSGILWEQQRQGWASSCCVWNSSYTNCKSEGALVYLLLVLGAKARPFMQPVSYLLCVPAPHWKGGLGCQSMKHLWKPGILVACQEQQD